MRPNNRPELVRIKKLKSNNSFEKACLLKELAIRLSKEGNTEECAEALGLASKEILKAGVTEEKPRELCKIARLYFKIGRQDKAKEAIDKALTLLEDVKEENPWKFTNYLCNVAYEVVRLGEGGGTVRTLLGRAIVSLGDVDAYYMKRKKEVLSLLKGFSEEPRLLPYLRFNLEPGIPADSLSGIPFKQTLSVLYSYIFLSHDEIQDLKSRVKNNAGKKEICRQASSIDEQWRQTVALAIISRLFLEESKVRRALEALHIASKKAGEIEFYWVRDNALEVIAGTFLEIYLTNKDNALIDYAKSTTSHIKDPWKKARSFCRIAATYIEEKRFKQAAQEINHISSHLLDKIEYRDRTAMSMLLIAEVFDRLGEEKASRLGGLFKKFDPDLGKAERLRKDASRIYDSFNHGRREEFWEEYRGFISLLEERT